MIPAAAGSEGVTPRQPLRWASGRLTGVTVGGRFAVAVGAADEAGAATAVSAARSATTLYIVTDASGRSSNSAGGPDSAPQRSHAASASGKRRIVVGLDPSYRKDRIDRTAALPTRQAWVATVPSVYLAATTVSAPFAVRSAA